MLTTIFFNIRMYNRDSFIYYLVYCTNALIRQLIV